MINIINKLFSWFRNHFLTISKWFLWILAGAILISLITLLITKMYQNWDDDPDRGATAISDGGFGESFSTPVYLDQGWSPADSLWYYNTTQGSDLIPYDFFLVLKREGADELFRSDANMDRYRYLPQKKTFFNPDALPVGFVKDTYKGEDYVGFTCAACHTGQVNFEGKAIRIDGGPAMADMDGMLKELESVMIATLNDEVRLGQFVEDVIGLGNNYRKEDRVKTDLAKWARTINLYNSVNHSSVEYGYARLDAFGRIFNRVSQHVLNRENLEGSMKLVTENGSRLLSDEQIGLVLEGVGEHIISNDEFAEVVDRLESKEGKYPGLSLEQLLLVRNKVFNEPNAPVSYPFLWDIPQSDYVQWNGLANNSGVGPLGRNAGEVLGVFGSLDWSVHKAKRFNLSAYLTKQTNKKMQMTFDSSVDMFNLERLENKLRTLRSPLWPEDILGKIDKEKAERGKLVYAEYCQSCHELVDRDDVDRLVIAEMSALDRVKTDEAMAQNSVTFKAKSGNLKHTTQDISEVGTVFIKEEAPVIQILTSATKGVIATPDPDKIFLRRWVERIYVIVSGLLNNNMPNTMKSGDYESNTTSNPYNSLLAYKGRSLNGIWATAPYLHNGSVPTLYDLLLPTEAWDGAPDGERRPDTFKVGSREFDPVKVGFRTEGYDGFEFKTVKRGDKNQGHEYAAGRTAQINGEILPPLDLPKRLDLLEYLKTL